MEFWIRVENDIITAVHYTTDGCYYSNKCGTTTAIMATEVPLSVAGQFTQSDILAVAGDIEQASEHCALLAANTSKPPLPTTGGNSTGQLAPETKPKRPHGPYSIPSRPCLFPAAAPTGGITPSWLSMAETAVSIPRRSWSALSRHGIRTIS